MTTQKTGVHPGARSTRPIAVLSIGELLADFIGNRESENVGQTQDFRRFQGGSAANLAVNMSIIGKSAALVACVGDDSLGNFLVDRVRECGVDIQFVVKDQHAPTSVVLVTRSTATPDFVAYRAADILLRREHIPFDALAGCAIYHSTCFALSRDPAQETILEGAEIAHQMGCRLSLDVNYHPSLWEKRQRALEVIARYCRFGTLVKASLDDLARLFGDHDLDEARAIANFHEWGAQLVCLTKGKAGSIVSWQHGKHMQAVAARTTTVVDTTGAGDAYWAGFLSAWLDGYKPPRCALAGSYLAAMKLSKAGPLTEHAGHQA